MNHPPHILRYHLLVTHHLSCRLPFATLRDRTRQAVSAYSSSSSLWSWLLLLHNPQFI